MCAHLLSPFAWWWWCRSGCVGRRPVRDVAAEAEDVDRLRGRRRRVRECQPRAQYAAAAVAGWRHLVHLAGGLARDDSDPPRGDAHAAGAVLRGDGGVRPQREREREAPPARCSRRAGYLQGTSRRARRVWREPVPCGKVHKAVARAPGAYELGLYVRGERVCGVRSRCKHKNNHL